MDPFYGLEEQGQSAKLESRPLKIAQGTRIVV